MADGAPNVAPAAQAASAPAAGLLPAAERDKLIPPSVFFRGQSATVQLRNSGAVRFADGMILFAAKVDTGGYATSVQERYQAYLVSEVPLRVGGSAAGKMLPAGAYGVGFLTDGFLVMDVGGHTLFTVPTSTQADLRRPMPLQIVAAPSGPAYRLYSGRTFVDLSRADAEAR